MKDQTIEARRRRIRLGALGGIAGPFVLGGTIASLTVAQYAFMRGLGWHPLRAPTFDWPSGLALGPYGDMMVGAFVGSGALLLGFAAALHAALPPGRGGRTVAGCWYAAAGALMGLGFRTDPSIRTTPRTLHGTLHDGAFAVLGLALLAGLALLVPQLQRMGWRRYARYTAVTALLVAPAFGLKGWFFWLFLGNMLAWIEITSWRLWQLRRGRQTHTGAV